jgi:hypothetical protein
MRRQSFWLVLGVGALVIGLTAIMVSLLAIALGYGWGPGLIGVILCGLALIILAVFLLLRANRIHPCVKRYFVTSLDTIDIMHKVDRGVPFSITIGKDTVQIRVEPDQILDEDTIIIEEHRQGEPSRRTLGKSPTFAGSVVDTEGKSDVRLFITKDVLAGYVLHAGSWWFVEPMRRFRIDANPSDYVVYRTRDLRFKLNLEDDEVPIKEEQFSPNNIPDGAGYLPDSSSSTPVPTPTAHTVGPSIGIALVADGEYYDITKWLGGQWYQEQLAVLNVVNGLFKKNLGCWFIPRVFICSRNDMPSCNASRLLDQLEDCVKKLWADLRPVQNRISKGTEVAHLTSGKNLDGSTLGIAWRPGVYSLSQHQLFWIGGGGGFGGPPNLMFENMMIMSHELGHNFNGVHVEADKWCVSHFIWCWDYERSLMWPTFYDDNNAWISDGSKNANHKNRQRMNRDMQSGRNRNF